MASSTISEEQFLLTELKYSLGQLHVQVLDLERDTRDKEENGKSIETILADMVQAEREFQAKIGGLTSLSTSDQPGEVEIPLPISSQEADESEESSFERLRAQSIALLERVAEPWSIELLDLAKAKVAGDRKCSTAIADVRRSHLEQANRTDLQQPLTDTLPHK